MRTRILTRADLEALAEMPAIVEAVEGAFRALAESRAQMPAKVYVDLPEHRGDFRAMPAATAEAAGLKWVNSHPENPVRHGLPAVMGVYVLNDPATAFPLAILDGTLLTALRTGAAAGVATRHLATRPATEVGFIGCGVQARFLWSAHRAVLGDDFTALCADRDPAAAERFAAEIRAAGLSAEASAVKTAAGAAIVNTATPGTAVAVAAGWLRSGAHVNAMGADAPGKQELESAAVAAARVVIDEAHQATQSGEINVPLREGALSEADLAGTLGEIVTGSRRVDREAITVFDSTGLAVQDVAVARLLYERARAEGVGLELDLVGAAR